jgi:hypothetical protein
MTAADLELYISTSDSKACQTITTAVRMIRTAVDRAARDLAKQNASWHDDPAGDPKGHRRHTAPADKQFRRDTRRKAAKALVAHWLNELDIQGGF